MFFPVKVQARLGLSPHTGDQRSVFDAPEKKTREKNASSLSKPASSRIEMCQGYFQQKPLYKRENECQFCFLIGPVERLKRITSPKQSSMPGWGRANSLKRGIIRRVRTTYGTMRASGSKGKNKEGWGRWQFHFQIAPILIQVGLNHSEEVTHKRTF